MAKVRVLCITFILSLIQSVCFAAVDPSKTGTFDKMQEVFMTYGVDGTFNLQNQALYLIGVFAVISLCTTWVLYTGEGQLQQMVSIIIKTSFFIMLALCWSDILNMIFSGFPRLVWLLRENLLMLKCGLLPVLFPWGIKRQEPYTMRFLILPVMRVVLKPLRMRFQISRRC